MYRLISRALGVFILLSLSLTAFAQTAQFSGRVTDPSQALVRGADIRVVNQATGIERKVKTNSDGLYTIPFVSPGTYQVFIQANGFSTAASEPITLTGGQALVFNVQLKVGSEQQQVAVNADDHDINTTDASVSTVIDRTFVENTPLNGRSFQSLILLTPGAVTNSPQRAAVPGSTGEFSINGERTESNYYTIDGVSANSGASVAPNAAGPTGSLPASTALGTTQSLVSVDALQEFRVESSTYSAEYGRSPGGQFSMVTRSGTNDWHGSVFDYFRNEALDANSWFNDNTVPITKKTPERQNDFGGTLGGPIVIPAIYNGKDHSFFFFSYEGLRLVQPQAATVNYVPDLVLRQSGSGAMQQVLNAFPLPTAGAPDSGTGFGEFIGAWSNPSQIDAISARVDHDLGQRTHLFFRFSDTPSSVSSRGTSAADSSPSAVTQAAYSAHTYTFGATTHIAHNLDNDLRLNYSSSAVHGSGYIDSLGGASPINLSQIQGISGTSSIEVGLYSDPAGDYPSLYSSYQTGQQRQWNLVDDVSLTRGRHTLKVGVDWRRLSPIIDQPATSANYFYDSEAAVIANLVDEGSGESIATNYPLYKNFSLFAQDEWKATSRLNVSAGIRWDVNPAPGVSRGLLPYTISGLNNVATMTLAPQGTPLWKTDWFSFAPRLGVAYVLNSDAAHETVIRSGGGVFFDTGQQTGSYGFSGPGFTAVNYFGTSYGVPGGFPVALSVVSPPIVSPPVAPYGPVYANPTHLQPPYSFQWNVSLEQAIGKSQSFSLSYVGSNGRKLLEESELSVAKYNPAFSTVVVYQNGLTSSYNSLQVKFQRQVTHGLQALGSYTWSHALDFGSYNLAVPYEHGNSDYDVRNNATGALSYDLPHSEGSSWLHALSTDWGVDGRFTARSGFPITLNGTGSFDLVSHQYFYGGLNRVPGSPLFLYGSHTTYPGGRRINPAAFTVPTTGLVGNASRNFVTGFGAVQTDFAFRRTFRIHDRFQGQFRAESFNIFNHPNFGTIGATCGGTAGHTCTNVQFGEATQILSQSLGVLSPLYQMGGPRSLQLSLRLTY